MYAIRSYYAALVIDYVLTVTISVAAGVDAVFSFLPLGWQAYKFSSIAFIIILLIVLNLRGVKESVAVLTPIFLAFIFCHIPLVLYTLLRHLPELPSLAATVSGDMSSAVGELGLRITSYNVCYTKLLRAKSSSPTFPCSPGRGR